jgi:hypothetical protein
MTKNIDANLVPDQYEIHEESGERFIFAQPNGEKIIFHEKPSIIKISAVAVAASAALVTGLVYWLAHVPH